MTPKARTPMRYRIQLATLAALVLAATSCGDVVRQGRSPVFLVITSLTASQGGGGGTPSGTLLSDVLTVPKSCTPTVTPCPPVIFNDLGQAAIALAPKDVAVAPTTNNQVTITRYHVEYTRADGRHTPGVDVPYGFDGAVTVTIAGTGSANIGFELVRNVAKLESPLVQLVLNPQIISTIANITFYGRDVTGNDISVTGSILIEFGNFGDS